MAVLLQPVPTGLNSSNLLVGTVELFEYTRDELAFGNSQVLDVGNNVPKRVVRAGQW